MNKTFYSNCFIQAILHKILHPFKVKLIHISKQINGHTHWAWTDGKFDYDFTYNEKEPKCYFIFNGHIRKQRAGTFKKYILLKTNKQLKGRN